MSVTINAKGTSTPYFKIGKRGTTLFQGSTDPSTLYEPVDGDMWINNATNSLSVKSANNWIAPILGVTNPLIFPVNSGNSGQVLSTDGEGNLTWISSSGSGTVTSASVVSANGFAGSVANSTTTPAITISTSVTGIIKGNGTAISSATAGTDYSAGTTSLDTGILKTTTSTGNLTIAVASDFPTLNQNTNGTANNITGIVTTEHGGTGLTSFTANRIFYAGDANTLSQSSGLTYNGANTLIVGSSGNGTISAGAGESLRLGSNNGNNIIVLGAAGDLSFAGSIGTSGQVLTSQGANTSPTWTTITSGVSSFSAGTSGLTPNTATTGAVVLDGTLNISHGGTGATTANEAFNNFLPSQITNEGKYLKTDGTNTSWSSVATAVGSLYEIQYSDGNGGFQSTSAFNYTSGTNTLTIGPAGSAVTSSITTTAPTGSAVTGTLRLLGSNASATNGIGGGITLLAGEARGTGKGGNITVTAGAGISATGNGGNISFTSGAGKAGGSVVLTSGTGITTTGGDFTLSSGQGTTNGGNFNLTAGDGGNNGGSVSIISGSTFSGVSGDVTIRAGQGGASGNGTLDLQVGAIRAKYSGGGDDPYVHEIGFFDVATVTQPAPTASGTGNVLSSIVSALNSLGLANTAGLTNITSTDTLAQSAYTQANNAYNQANTATTLAQSAYNKANSAITIGTTAISLGSSSTTLSGLTSVSSTAFTGALTGNADTATALQTSRTISATGDATWSVSFNGSANTTAALTLATVATAGTYKSVTVDVKGRVTAGTNPTTLAGYGITDAVSNTGNSLPVTYGNISSAQLITSTTSANQVVDSFSASTYRTVKYLVQATSSTSYQSSEIMIIHNGTTAFVSEYGIVMTNTSLASFDADVSGGNVRLLVTPTNAVTTINVVRTTIVV